MFTKHQQLPSPDDEHVDEYCASIGHQTPLDFTKRAEVPPPWHGGCPIEVSITDS